MQNAARESPKFECAFFGPGQNASVRYLVSSYCNEERGRQNLAMNDTFRGAAEDTEPSERTEP